MKYFLLVPVPCIPGAPSAVPSPRPQALCPRPCCRALLRGHQCHPHCRALLPRSLSATQSRVQQQAHATCSVAALSDACPLPLSSVLTAQWVLRISLWKMPCEVGNVGTALCFPRTALCCSLQSSPLLSLWIQCQNLCSSLASSSKAFYKYLNKQP